MKTTPNATKRVLENNTIMIQCNCGWTCYSSPAYLKRLYGETCGNCKQTLVFEVPRPTIVCLCGSTRFIEQMAIKAWELEKEGNIVLSCHLLPKWYCDAPDHFAEVEGVAKQMDQLHMRKIDLADEVLFLNVGGYLGESSRNELQYARDKGKVIRFLESPGF